MNLQFYLEKLFESDEFKKFKKENPDCFFCSGFLIIDKVGEENKQHFDFYVPASPQTQPKVTRSQVREIDNKLLTKKSDVNKNSAEKSSKADFRADKISEHSEGKLFSFQLENGVKKSEIKMIGNKISNKVLLDVDIDFDDVEKIILEEITQEGIKNKIQKILLSLQCLENRNFLIGTVFISGLGLLKINIDVSKKKITHFEKKSFFDMINVLKKK